MFVTKTRGWGGGQTQGVDHSVQSEPLLCSPPMRYNKVANEWFEKLNTNLTNITNKTLPFFNRCETICNYFNTIHLLSRCCC